MNGIRESLQGMNGFSETKNVSGRTANYWRYSNAVTILKGKPHILKTVQLKSEH